MSADTQLRSALEEAVGETGVDLQRDLRAVEERATRVSRRRRVVTLASVVAVTVLAVVTAAALQRGHDASVATPTRSVEVKRHVGAGGQIFGPLVGSTSESLSAAQYTAEPEFIAVLADGDSAIELVGYVKRGEALTKTDAGTYEWSDNFLAVYAEDGVTVVGQFVGHHSFLTFGSNGWTKLSPATLEAGVLPSGAWYDQLVGSCASMQEAVVPGPDGQPSSAAHAGMVSVYDHGIGAPIQMPIAQFCSEQAALSPDPMGNLTGSFTVENGHVTATYNALNRIVQNGAEVAQAGESVPFDEAQRIIAEQRRASAHS